MPLGDLLHGVAALVVEALGLFDLVGGEFRPSAAFAAAGAGGFETVVGVGKYQFPLQLRQHTQHAEHGAAFGGVGVDALLDHLQPDPALAQLRAEGDQVQHRPAEPVEAGDDDGVATARESEHEIEFRSRCLRATGSIDMDIGRFDAGATQGVDLVGRILFGG